MTSNKPLSTFGISSAVIAKLLEHGFAYEKDIKDLKPSDIQSATGLTLQEAAEVISTVLDLAKIAPTSALQLIKEDACSIISFSEELDKLLGGGFPLKAITELCGTPGIGKTQMCMQACVSVQIPTALGGLGGEAIYVDTEGSFTVSRLKVVKHLPQFLESHEKVSLFIIDSIAFHFRHDFSDFKARTSVLCQLTQELIQLARKYSLAVIVTNQMTMRFDREGTSELVAALGETWGHCPTLRVLLHWSQDNTRVAKILKAPHQPSLSCFYQVTVGGIRDIPKVETCKITSLKRKIEDT